jgi:hypothetical protein
MEKSRHLIKLAQKLSNKYAGMNAEIFRSQIETAVWTAIRNASTSQSSGIMPFVRMAQKDGVTVSFDVTRNDSSMGGTTITVSEIQVNPAGHLADYQPLAGQVKTYLEKNPELYPTVASGIKLNYDNFTISLSYPNSNAAPIAQQ